MPDSSFIKLASFFGIINPILTFILIGLAISQASWFSWTENALSDLGVHAESATLFNSGLILGGILTLVFAFGMLRFYGDQAVGRGGAFFLLLAGIFLASIGIFPETAPNNIHYVVSVAFFAALPLSLLFQSVALLQKPKNRTLGAFTLAMAIIALIPWTIWIPLKPYRGVAIPELVSAAAAAFWSISMGTKLMRQREPC